MYQDLHIIDFHSHFPTNLPWSGNNKSNRKQDYAQRIGQKRAAIAQQFARAYNHDWRMAWDFEPAESQPPDDDTQAARWAAEVEKYGLRAVVFVTGGGNDHLSEIIHKYPHKFIGFAHHSPFTTTAAQEIHRAVNELGLKGYKLAAPALEHPIDDHAAYPVWEACAEHNLPVLIHFGVLGSGGGIAWHENINPLTLHNVAKDFPDVNFVVPHFGCGWIREALQLTWACGNVFIDTSGSNQWVRWMDGDWTVKKLFRKYLETIGAERLIFGTDSSFFPRGFSIRYLQDQIRDTRELNLTHAQLQMIFGGNAARLLKIDLESYPTA